MRVGLALLFAVSLGVGGCALTVHSIEIARTVEQNALVPAPTGPRATGPRADDRRWAVELGYSYNPVSASGRSHFEGERGDVVVEHMVRARAAVGLGGVFELGFDLEFGNAAFGKSVAADGRRAGIGQRFGRGGPSFRALFPMGKRARLGGVLELELASIPFRIEVYERAWETTKTVVVAGDPWWIEPSERERYLGDRLYGGQRSVFVPMVRSGVQLGIDLSPRVMLMLGAIGQNVPTFRGAWRKTIRCVGFDASSPEICAAAHPVRGPTIEHVAVGTLSAALSVRMGRVIALAQIAGHVLAPDSIRAATPVSLDLGARYQF